MEEIIYVMYEGNAFFEKTEDGIVIFADLIFDQYVITIIKISLEIISNMDI